ncbi:sensor histidine kinase [Flavihumibacter petaseus]|uniref:sensor histidine kinase n=1 Tax=Flavihumibacter petaseus TaxID=549295 RepID=UPI000A899776|nr:histidine kinase [Flavihumibacter petaseus]
MFPGTINKKQVALHLSGWLLLLAVWYFLRYEDFSSPGLAFRITLLKVADLAIMVYITNYLLLPKLLYRKKYLLFFLSYLGMIVASSLFKMKAIGVLMHHPDVFDIAGNLKARIYDNFLPHFFLVTAGAALKLWFDHNRMQKRMADLAREKAEAELHFLKSQINPHFLFNSLNAVYFLINKDNTDARKALHTFSDMLRFQLYGTGEDRISIEQEIAYLEDYIALQRLRLNENNRIAFHKSPGLTGYKLEPFLLLPLVENAFKHLSHFGPEQLNEISLDLSCRDGNLLFTVENTREAIAANGSAGGIGLANVQRRLQLLYPGKHRLLVDDQPDRFRIQMEIPV